MAMMVTVTTAVETMAGTTTGPIYPTEHGASELTSAPRDEKEANDCEDKRHDCNGRIGEAKKEKIAREKKAPSTDKFD